MSKNLVIIGIDSLDPYILLRYREELPNFSKLIEKSPTFVTKPIFPVDTIPNWGSIYTGLHPGNHGLLYVYDIFDPTLSDLNKLDVNYLRGKTFWDYAGLEEYKTIVAFPALIYPSWEINGIMVSKCLFEKRINWLKTERDISISPIAIKEKYAIPDKTKDIWGGFPGIDHLKKWAELGKDAINNDNNIGLKLYTKEDWDLFFMYFSHLDIIQHRLWRFFDREDPTYVRNNLSKIILDYYKMFDKIIGDFIDIRPDANFIVMSDHGHMVRPVNTVNINEYLKRKGFLISHDNKIPMNKIRKIILDIANRLNIEHWLMKLIVKNRRLIKTSKSVYSSTGSIDLNSSKAFLSDFAGIKSYSHGGIEINKELVSCTEYEKVVNELIRSLSMLTINDVPMVDWIKRREDLYPGKFTEKIYPDIIFELKKNYGVGWELHSKLSGYAYDHKVASGGHRGEAVFLMRNNKKIIEKRDISIIDIAPTILDILEMDWKQFNFDGRSMVKNI